MNDTITDQQNALARVRRIMKPKPAAEQPGPVRRGATKADRFKYERKEIMIRDSGVLLDPNRTVCDWLPTVYDGLFRFDFVSTPEGEKLDFGDGPGVSINDGGPFRVRVLGSFMGWERNRLDIGEVIEVPATRYCVIRSAELAGSNRPRFEPVPSDEPLRGAILPADFPSITAEARTVAAKALGKAEAELSFEEVVRYYEKRKKKVETFGG